MSDEVGSEMFPESGAPDQAAKGQGGTPAAQPLASALRAMVPFVQISLLAIGAASVHGSVASSWGTGDRAGRVSVLIAALGTLVYYVLLARLTGPVLRAAAMAIVLWERRTVAAERLAERLAALERVADAMEQSPAPAPQYQVPVPPAGSDPQTEIRAAIQTADWARSQELIGAYLEAHPGDPAGPRLAHEREEALAGHIQALRAKVASAREVNDPNHALELRDALVPLLDAEALRSLDQELVRWLMNLIQKRLRAGTMRVDVAELAGLVAERFDHTVEGASLRASLPTLRRSAGLCARCGQPYTGIADACPACQSTASFPAFGHTPAADPDDLDEWPGDHEEEPA